MASPGLTVVLVVPDTNTTMERELRAQWPEVTELHRVGIPRPMRPIVAGDLPEYRANTLKAVAGLGSVKADILLYGCTTAGFLSGPAGDRDMQKALADAMGAPAVTTASSMAEAMQRAGVSHPAIVTPYLEASNQGLKSFLAAKGIHVSILESFLFTTTDQYDRVTADEVHGLAAITGSDPRADSLFIACTQLPTLGILDKLRARLKKPVFSAVEATISNARQTLAARS
jgi:maleate cis-trans isomerase